MIREELIQLLKQSNYRLVYNAISKRYKLYTYNGFYKVVNADYITKPTVKDMLPHLKIIQERQNQIIYGNLDQDYSDKVVKPRRNK